jgi:hypothetical protein
MAQTSHIECKKDHLEILEETVVKTLDKGCGIISSQLVDVHPPKKEAVRYVIMPNRAQAPYSFSEGVAWLVW